MVAAVIVTYNRKTELCKNLEMLYAQSVYLDKIIVVDNCSTDGTKEQLDAKGYLRKINFQYLKTEKNIGGAGGFYTGIRTAYEQKFDWIILMDDDGRPYDENTFKVLIDYAETMKKQKIAAGKLFINSLVVCGDRLTSKIDNMYKVEDAINAAKEGVIVGAAHPFNGTLISRELVEKIGYPNKEFFIKGDEIDYKQRAIDAGGYVATLIDSKYYHPYVPTKEKVLLGKLVPVCVEAPWKEYYSARNLTYTYKKKKHYKMIAFELVFVKIYAIATMKCPKVKTLIFMLRGLLDGWNGKLGAIVKP